MINFKGIIINNIREYYGISEDKEKIDISFLYDYLYRMAQKYDQNYQFNLESDFREKETGYSNPQWFLTYENIDDNNSDDMVGKDKNKPSLGCIVHKNMELRYKGILPIYLEDMEESYKVPSNIFGTIFFFIQNLRTVFERKNKKKNKIVNFLKRI